MPIVLSSERDGAIENKWNSVPYEEYVLLSSIPTVSRSSRGSTFLCIEADSMWEYGRKIVDQWNQRHVSYMYRRLCRCFGARSRGPAVMVGEVPQFRGYSVEGNSILVTALPDVDRITQYTSAYDGVREFR